MTSKRESYANYLVELVKNFHRVEEVDTEVKSIFFCAVTHQLQRVSFCSMYIKLLQEEFIPPEKVVLLLDSQCT